MGATLHCGAWASHYRGLSCCGAQTPDAQAQQLWLTGLVAPRHVGSSQTRARTRVPCISRQILNHCATREAPGKLLFTDFSANLKQAIQSLISILPLAISEEGWVPFSSHCPRLLSPCVAAVSFLPQGTYTLLASSGLALQEWKPRPEAPVPPVSNMSR